MTKQELSQYCDLQKEIAEVQNEINQIQERGKVTDKVQASSSEYPYLQTGIKITGYKENSKSKKRRNQLQMLLAARKEQAEKLELEITKYINGISDSRTRRIMHYKYIKGYTWEKIGKLMHCDRTTAEKTATKYINKH